MANIVQFANVVAEDAPVLLPLVLLSVVTTKVRAAVTARPGRTAPAPARYLALRESGAAIAHHSARIAPLVSIMTLRGRALAKTAPQGVTALVPALMPARSALLAPLQLPAPSFAPPARQIPTTTSMEALAPLAPPG